MVRWCHQIKYKILYIITSFGHTEMCILYFFKEADLINWWPLCLTYLYNVHPSMLWFYFRLPPRQHGWWWFPSACCPPPSSPPPARPPGPPAASPQRRRTARRRPAFATGPPTHCLDRAESSGSSVPPALGWRTARDDRCPRDGPPGGAPDTSFAKQT